jgi:16S rRNA (cytosine1402-N4)-methyltransferase
VPPISGHVPVLLDAVVEHLRPTPGSRVLDCTCGLGGHSEALLLRGCLVQGVDRDAQARELACRRLAPFQDRFSVRGGTFAAAAAAFIAAGERFDAVLADLGVSSMQLDDEARGFSWRTARRTDMRMGDDCPADALELIDRLEEDALADIIYRYGEERLSRRIARALKRARAEGAESGQQLAETIRAVVPGHQPRHPAIRTFQALRIAVNDELGELERLLAILPDLLVPGGRAAVISFHSLEDRMVKQTFRAYRDAGRMDPIAKKPVIASEAEIAANPRASSAKLRWAVRS